MRCTNLNFRQMDRGLFLAIYCVSWRPQISWKRVWRRGMINLTPTKITGGGCNATGGKAKAASPSISSLAHLRFGRGTDRRASAVFFCTSRVRQSVAPAGHPYSATAHHSVPTGKKVACFLPRKCSEIPDGNKTIQTVTLYLLAPR